MDEPRNPYVGPRPFERDDRAYFFGREREIRDVAALIVAQPVLLLYAASGAGKSSLLNAGVLPALEERGHEILRPVRVVAVGEPPAGAANVYAHSLLTQLRGDAASDGGLADFLTRRADGEGLRVLVVDQFEEFFSVYPEHWRQRPGLFRTLCDALESDARLRLVIAIREDHLAFLDPLAPLLPGGLRNRFRLERLDEDGGRAAVKRPLELTPRRFAPGVAEALVGDLLKFRIATHGGSSREVEGEFVEPVQLQVVCRALWDELPPGVEEITSQHLRALADVDTVLARFYEDALRAAVATGKVKERRMRDWIEDELITSGGTRGSVYGAGQSIEGMPEAAVSAVEEKRLVRAEWRAGARWYELTHDRLIEPIRASNSAARSRARQRRWYRVLGATVGALVAAAVALGVVAYSSRAGSEAEASPDERRLRAELREERASQDALITIFGRAGEPAIAASSLSPDGEFVLQARGGPVMIWDTETGQNPGYLPARRVTSVSFDRPGERVVVTTGDGEIRLWNWVRLRTIVATRDALLEFQRERGLVPDGVLGPQTIAALGRRTTTRYASAGRSPARDTAFSFDNELLATAHDDGVVLVRDVGDGSAVAKLEGIQVPLATVAFGPGPSLVATRKDHAVVWNWRTGRAVRTLDHDGIRAAEFGGPDRGLLATAGESGEVSIWDGNGRRRLTFRASEGPLLDLAFSAAGDRLVTAHDDGTAAVWELRATEGAPQVSRIIVLTGHRDAVTSASFGPDGAIVATSSCDGTTRLWSASQR